MLRRIKDTFRPYLPRNIRRTLLDRKDGRSGHYHIFSSKPAVVMITRKESSGIIHNEMPDCRLILLYLFAWTVTPKDVSSMSLKIRNDLKAHPNHRVVILCNELASVDLFKAEGVEAIFCNHNCWVNENYFTIDPTQEKKYDAIYNAAMAPYKRHFLATKVSSLALITYQYSGTHESDYEVQTRASLAHANWLVDARVDSQKASSSDVARYNNQSRVGLCLSAHEGAMFASIEYLLCGLPVVTTRNTGGRDAFFEPEYVEFVEDDPDSVSQGVANLIARAPGPEVIRARTLAKMDEHRQRFREALKNEVPEFEIPWQPGTQGPLLHQDLRVLGKTLRKAST